MKELSPLAKKYKDAFEGKMIVFDMDGMGNCFFFHRYTVVVLARYPSQPSNSFKRTGLCR